MEPEIEVEATITFTIQKSKFPYGESRARSDTVMELGRMLKGSFIKNPIIKSFTFKEVKDAKA